MWARSSCCDCICAACVSPTGRGCSKPLPWAQRLLAAPSKGKNQVGWGGSGGRLPQEGATLTGTVVLQWSSLQSQEAHLPSVGSEPGFTAFRDEKHVLWLSRTSSSLLKSVNVGSTGSTGTTKDTEPFSFGRQLTWSFIKESKLGFYYELRSLESAHCGKPKPTFLWCRIYNMSTWPYSVWLWSKDETWFKQMSIPWSKITRVPQQYFRMLLPSLYEPCPSSQRGWPMKPWDSARALQVCGENPDRFILGELSISVLHPDGVVSDFRISDGDIFNRVNNVRYMKMSYLVKHNFHFHSVWKWSSLLTCSGVL